MSNGREILKRRERKKKQVGKREKKESVGMGSYFNINLKGQIINSLIIFTCSSFD